MNTSFPTFFRRGGSVLVLSFVFASGLRAEEKPRPSLAEPTSAAFRQIPPLVTDKKWDAIFALLDAVPNVGPTSYDRALILDTKAKIYLQQEKLKEAIAPQEEALKLSDTYGYFDEKQNQQTINLLARLLYAEAINIKDPVQQGDYIKRAAGYLKRYLDHEKKPTPDDTMFYAQLLYGQAIADPKNMDKGKIKEAREVVEKGMLSAIHPKEGFYQLLLALLQQENDYARSAEVLELTLKQFPAKKDYYPVLAGTYLQLANDKDETKQRDNYVRAINTIERAQSLGIMTDPKWNYNLVTIYSAASQFSQATDVLHGGLKKGTIESSVANWRILGDFYQRANKEMEAVAALQEASKLFPNDGMLDLQMGEIYRGMEKTKESRDSYRRAIQKKATLDKPHIAYQLLAFAAMELEEWDEALEAITAASKYPEFQKDRQMMSLKEHIENTVNERNEAKDLKAKEKAKETKPAATAAKDSPSPSDAKQPAPASIKK